jgi:hypothetical protein
MACSTPAGSSSRRRYECEKRCGDIKMLPSKIPIKSIVDFFIIQLYAKILPMVL